jgi:sugar lactone lactonase YvrE
VVAGTGRVGHAGDGGPAARATLHDPQGMAVAADGTLFFADEGNHRVRAIMPSGRMIAVAGSGSAPGAGFVHSGTPAKSARIDPSAVAFGPDGDLYIAANTQVLRLNHDGTLTPVLGGHDESHQGVPYVHGLAANASADGANGLAFDRHGDLYVSGENTKTLIEIDRRGVVHVIGKPIGFYPRGNGGLVATPRGPVIAMDDLQVVEVSPAGVHAIVTTHQLGFPGLGAFEIDGIAVNPAGDIYVDTFDGNGYANASAVAEVRANGGSTLLWRSS